MEFGPEFFGVNKDVLHVRAGAVNRGVDVVPRVLAGIELRIWSSC